MGPVSLQPTSDGLEPTSDGAAAQRLGVGSVPFVALCFWMFLVSFVRGHATFSFQFFAGIGTT